MNEANPRDMGTTGLVKFSLRGIRFFAPMGPALSENFGIAQDIIAERNPVDRSKNPYLLDSEAVFRFRDCVFSIRTRYAEKFKQWRLKNES